MSELHRKRCNRCKYLERKQSLNISITSLHIFQLFYKWKDFCFEFSSVKCLPSKSPIVKIHGRQ